MTCMGEEESVCALCGEPLATSIFAAASDGLLVHERCESEYEDSVYFREFDGNDDDV